FVPPEGVIAFEDVLMVRIVDVTKPAGFGAIASRKSDAPAIGNRKKIVLGKRSPERGGAGVALGRDLHFRRRLVRNFRRRRNLGRWLLQRHRIGCRSSWRWRLSRCTRAPRRQQRILIGFLRGRG